MKSVFLSVLGLLVAVPVEAGAEQVAGPPASSPAQEPEPIVVTGQQAERVRRQIRDYVQRLTPGAGGRHIALFNDPVCPAVFGLTPQRNAQIRERMRRVAQVTSIRLGPDNCAPNVLLIVVPNKAAFLRRLERSEPSFFADLTSAQVRRIMTAPGYATAWSLDGPPVNVHGIELYFDPALGMYRNSTMEPATRMRDLARPQYTAAVVVVESTALDGLSTTQLADYAAMRGYANLDPARLGSEPPPTILGAVDAAANAQVPLSVTSWDLGYLRGLYGGDPNRYISGQRAAIRDSIAREVGVDRNSGSMD